ncbi:hypothetical protein D3C87_1225850 [compost metagenome]
MHSQAWLLDYFNSSRCCHRYLVINFGHATFIAILRWDLVVDIPELAEDFIVVNREGFHRQRHWLAVTRNDLVQLNDRFAIGLQERMQVRCNTVIRTCAVLLRVITVRQDGAQQLQQYRTLLRLDFDAEDFRFFSFQQLDQREADHS